MITSERGIQLIKHHEGIRNRPYRCAAGLWTIGVGHLIGDGKSLPPEYNRVFTKEEIDAILKLINHKEGISSHAGSTMYISHITKSGVGLARPCVRCMELARSVGIKEIIYTSNNSNSIREKL